jgi:hypothetical protein
LGSITDPAADDHTIHNPLVAGTDVLLSWHSDDIQVVDASDPSHPDEVAHFVSPASHNPVMPSQRGVLTNTTLGGTSRTTRYRAHPRQRHEPWVSGSCAELGDHRWSHATGEPVVPSRWRGTVMGTAVAATNVRAGRCKALSYAGMPRQLLHLPTFCQRTGGSWRLAGCHVAPSRVHITWWRGSRCSYKAGVGGSSPSAPTKPQVGAPRAVI